MTGYFVSGALTALLFCGVARWWMQALLNKEKLKLDDAKGYYLVSCFVVGFLVSAGFFFLGQQIGYDQQADTSQAMGLAVLLDVMTALLCLIWGLVTLHEPEQY